MVSKKGEIEKQRYSKVQGQEGTRKAAVCEVLDSGAGEVLAMQDSAAGLAVDSIDEWRRRKLNQYQQCRVAVVAAEERQQLPVPGPTDSQ